MRLIKWAIIIFAFFWLAKFLPQTKFGSAASGRWEAVQPITGAGDDTTFPIRSPKSQSRVHWEVNNPWSEATRFNVRVMNADGKQLKVMANISIPGGSKKSGDYFVGETEQYYLVIHTTASWEFNVEVLQ